MLYNRPRSEVTQGLVVIRDHQPNAVLIRLRCGMVSTTYSCLWVSMGLWKVSSTLSTTQWEKSENGYYESGRDF